MIKISADEIQKWRTEIDQAEDFRDKNFGKNIYTDKTRAGENIDYFETGISWKLLKNYDIDEAYPTINVIYPIVKNVIPTLYYKNPYVLALPKRNDPADEESAPYAGGLINYYHKELDLKSVNKQIVFDAYVLGMGVCKIGYTTKFGNMPTEQNVKQEQKDREKAKAKGILEQLGLRKPREEDKPIQNPELNEFIRSESPYVVWVDPFRFGIDPHATSIENARYVYEKVTKLLVNVKSDKNYKNTSQLKGNPIEDINLSNMPETQIDNFKTVDLYELHYKTDEGINILVLAKDGRSWQHLRHEKSIYEIDGFQYELLYFNKHNHKLYPKSDIDVVKGLQDRIQQTFENILDQIDKFVPKLGIDETALTVAGKRAMETGDIGAIVTFNKNPGEAFKEIAFTQLKGDLVALIDKVIEIMMLETGLTRAQLMGLTQAATATEAQIGQAGQNLRLSDKFDSVSGFLNRQSRKLWQVVRQFVNLEEISLILGESNFDSTTGQVAYSWMPDITSEMSEKLGKGEYRFEIEVGSTEKPDLPVLRKQVENLVNILGGEGVLQVAQQGYRVELAELFREYLGLYPNMFKNPSRIIKPIQDPQQSGVMPPQPPGPGGPASGQGVRPQQRQANPPTPADLISATGGEKGGQIPLA